MSVKKRTFSTITMAVAAMAIAVPASAESAAISAIETGNVLAAHNVASTCLATGGVALDLNTITYEVVAESKATSRTSAAVGTSVECEIYNTSTGQVYGRLAAGLPGAVAAVADKVTFPRTADVAARVCGSALYTDATTESTC